MGGYRKINLALKAQLQKIDKNTYNTNTSHPNENKQESLKKVLLLKQSNQDDSIAQPNVRKGGSESPARNEDNDNPSKNWTNFNIGDLTSKRTPKIHINDRKDFSNRDNNKKQILSTSNDVGIINQGSSSLGYKKNSTPKTAKQKYIVLDKEAYRATSRDGSQQNKNSVSKNLQSFKVDLNYPNTKNHGAGMHINVVGNTSKSKEQMIISEDRQINHNRSSIPGVINANSTFVKKSEIFKKTNKIPSSKELNIQINRGVDDLSKKNDMIKNSLANFGNMGYHVPNSVNYKNSTTRGGKNKGFEINKTCEIMNQSNSGHFGANRKPKKDLHENVNSSNPMKHSNNGGDVKYSPYMQMTSSQAPQTNYQLIANQKKHIIVNLLPQKNETKIIKFNNTHKSQQEIDNTKVFSKTESQRETKYAVSRNNNNNFSDSRGFTNGRSEGKGMISDIQNQQKTCLIKAYEQNQDQNDNSQDIVKTPTEGRSNDAGVLRSDLNQRRFTLKDLENKDYNKERTQPPSISCDSRKAMKKHTSRNNKEDAPSNNIGGNIHANFDGEHVPKIVSGKLGEYGERPKPMEAQAGRAKMNQLHKTTKPKNYKQLNIQTKAINVKSEEIDFTNPDSFAVKKTDRKSPKKKHDQPAIFLLKELGRHEKYDDHHMYLLRQTLRGANVREKSNQRAHFLNSVQAILFKQLNYYGKLPSVDPSKLVDVPPTAPGKKLIIFDLDETLLHCKDQSVGDCMIRKPVTFSNGVTITVIFVLIKKQAGINLRPYMKEQLIQLQPHFDQVVFTASHHMYGGSMIDIIDPNNQIFLKRVFRDNCLKTKEGILVKDQRIFKGRSLKDVVQVDNAVISFVFNLDNGVPILSFTDDDQDYQFVSLGRFLMSLKDVPDVRPVIFKQFCWKAFLDNPGVERNIIQQILNKH